jgi:hypothetical protein
MNALKSWAISHLTVGLKTDVLETFSVSIIRVNVGNIHTLLITELYIFYSDGSGVVPSSWVSSPSSCPPPPPRGVCGMNRVQLLSLLLPCDFPFLPCLERKTFGVDGNKRAVFAYNRSVKWVAKLCFELVSPNCVSILRSGRWGQGPPWCNSNVSFSFGLLWQGFLFDNKLFFVWVCYCPT